MNIFNGKGVYGGIAVGRLKVIKNNDSHVRKIYSDDSESEIKRFENARKKASDELEMLYEKAVREIGETSASIFEIHRMMLDDSDYIESVENIIRTQSVNAEYAVSVTGDNFSNIFADMDDDYMKARSTDVKDISERLIKAMGGDNKDENTFQQKSIILAEDLAPSQTVQLDKEKVLAFVTVHGSSNSHTAILAKSMNIPSIVGCKININNSFDGRLAVVDGYTGRLHIDPDEKTLSEMLKRQKDDEEKHKLLLDLKGKDNVTVDGKKIKLYANISSLKDLASVFINDADGIGLFRSEFIYLEKNTFPTEEEQFAIYKKVAETMADKKVIIRTLDIGADKQADYFNLGKEENPAMGYRAIRICLTQTDIFKTQLRAILRAGVFGNISIMYPMITSLSEIKRIKEIVMEVKRELSQEKTAFADVEQGIMIETPASAIISDMLAGEVDFFSIGTNDLTQYTLAVDRQNEKADDFYDPHHPAVLRMIQKVIDSAHEAGIWAGICGELGSDTSLTETFLKMGIDELSVSPSEVLKVRKRIRETDLRQNGDSH